jgi:hypothetical protein
MTTCTHLNQARDVTPRTDGCEESLKTGDELFLPLPLLPRSHRHTRFYAVTFYIRNDFYLLAPRAASRSGLQSGQETEPRRHDGRKMIPLSRYQFIRCFMSRFFLHVQERESRIDKSIQESTQCLAIFTRSGRPGER